VSSDVSVQVADPRKLRVAHCTHKRLQTALNLKQKRYV
jgi:hypothetical protein